eukprot:5760283-Pleurochrysis_carterae.AAC.1
MKYHDHSSKKKRLVDKPPSDFKQASNLEREHSLETSRAHRIMCTYDLKPSASTQMAVTDVPVSMCAAETHVI